MKTFIWHIFPALWGHAKETDHNTGYARQSRTCYLWVSGAHLLLAEKDKNKFSFTVKWAGGEWHAGELWSGGRVKYFPRVYPLPARAPPSSIHHPCREWNRRRRETRGVLTFMFVFLHAGAATRQWTGFLIRLLSFVISWHSWTASAGLTFHLSFAAAGLPDSKFQIHLSPT